MTTFKEITTLVELREYDELTLNSTEVEEVIESAKGRNEFYVGTDMKEFLNSFDVVTEEEFEELEWNNETEFEVLTHDNTYNYGGNGSTDIDYKILYSDYHDNTYVLVRVHIGTDIRGGYTKAILLDLKCDSTDPLYNFVDYAYECQSESGYIEVEGVGFSFSGDIFSEGVQVYNHSTDEDYMLYGGFYNNDKEDFEAELLEALKENELV